ncbi:MAG: outer membrane lipoprotein-sorting protein [Rickettsiales bacterium]
MSDGRYFFAHSSSRLFSNFLEMIKKLIFLLALIALNPLPAMADVFDHPVKNEDLQMVKSSIPEPEILRGDFKQTKILQDLDRDFISYGKFIFTKKDGLYWHMKKPFELINVFTKNGLMSIEDGQKNLISAEESPIFKEISEIFQTILVADVDRLKDHFEIFFTQNNQNWILGLEAKNEAVKNVANKITITGKDFVTKIILEEQALGETKCDLTIIEFSNLSQNKLTQDEENYFQF